MQAKTDHKRGFVWGLAFAVTMTISSIWGQAVSSGQFVRAAQVEVTPVPAAQQTNIPQMDPTAVPNIDAGICTGNQNADDEIPSNADSQAKRIWHD